MSGQAIVKIKDKQWNVSLATTYSELAAGLGGVPSIPAGTGMLFDLGHDQHITITSEGMLFPIDTAFISSSLTVVEIVQDLVTGSPHEVTSSVPVRFFLEVNASEMDDIDLGDPVVIQGYEPQVVRPLWFWSAVQIMVVIGLLALQARAMLRGVEEPVGTSIYRRDRRE